MNREEIQEKCLKLILENNNTIVELATSVGKSLIAINAIEEIGGKWSIVLAETNHKLTWEAEFKKHNKEHLLKDIKFFCYQSLHKHLTDTHLVMDEIHHLLTSEKRLDMLSKLNPIKFIGLSATLSRTQKENLFNNLGKFAIYKVSLSEAIDMNILPEPKVYFIKVSLDNIKKDFKFHWAKDKIVMCTEQEYYVNISNRIEFFKLKYFNSHNEFDKNKWLKCATDRKRFLSSIKTKFVKETLTKTTKRLICFTGSIEQAEELSNGKTAIHSKLSEDKRKSLIEGFNTGKIDRLFAVGMLRESMNLNNIELGIIQQLDNNTKMYNQVTGRSMRSLSPLQYVFYVKDTQDEVYTQTVLEDFDKKYIEFLDYEQFIKTI